MESRPALSARPRRVSDAFAQGEKAMKIRTTTVIQRAISVVIGLMLAQTSDAQNRQAWASSDHAKTPAVQIAQNAGWCCVNGKIEQLNQRI
jgi:hypothetical protein